MMLSLESVQVFDKQLLGSVSAEVVPLVFKSLKHFTKQTNQKKKKKTVLGLDPLFLYTPD